MTALAKMTPMEIVMEDMLRAQLVDYRTFLSRVAIPSKVTP